MVRLATKVGILRYQLAISVALRLLPPSTTPHEGVEPGVEIENQVDRVHLVAPESSIEASI
jgi:hypothetical protein